MYCRRGFKDFWSLGFRGFEGFEGFEGCGVYGVGRYRSLKGFWLYPKAQNNPTASYSMVFGPKLNPKP